MSVAGFVLPTLATLAGSFTCTVEQVAAISYANGEMVASRIHGFPYSNLTFALDIEGNEVAIDWPESPIQVHGRQPLLATGPETVSAIFVTEGPCYFTEWHCGSTLSFAAQDNGSLKLLANPTAVSTDRENDSRFPYLIWMSGLCTPRESQ